MQKDYVYNNKKIYHQRHHLVMMTAFYIKASLRKISHTRKGLQQPTNFAFTTLVSGVSDGYSDYDCVMSVCCGLELCHSYLIKNDTYQR